MFANSNFAFRDFTGTRFAKDNKKLLKANFNGDLVQVAAEKVQQLELVSVGSHDTSKMSNGERV